MLKCFEFDKLRYFVSIMFLESEHAGKLASRNSSSLSALNSWNLLKLSKRSTVVSIIFSRKALA